MLDALHDAGWSNYSLFLTDDGLLVGYLETDDYAAAQQQMAGTAVKVDDYEALSRHAAAAGVAIGTVNANVFQDDDYKLGSVCHPDSRVRRKAVAHLIERVD